MCTSSVQCPTNLTLKKTIQGHLIVTYCPCFHSKLSLRFTQQRAKYMSLVPGQKSSVCVKKKS